MNKPFLSIISTIYIISCVCAFANNIDFNTALDNYSTRIESEQKAREEEERRIREEKRIVEIRKTSPKLYESSYFKKRGVINWNGYRWTWYSQKKLPGNRLNIPGRHVDENNYICDKDDYICLASSDLKKGTVVDTPFGKKGKIYDCGCSHGTLDVYTNF